VAFERVVQSVWRTAATVLSGRILEGCRSTGCRTKVGQASGLYSVKAVSDAGRYRFTSSAVSAMACQLHSPRMGRMSRYWT